MKWITSQPFNNMALSIKMISFAEGSFKNPKSKSLNKISLNQTKIMSK